MALLIAAAVAAVGSCLNWATIDAGFTTLHKGGLDGDGVITLVLAVGIAILAGVRKVPVLGLLIALGVLAVALYDVIDILTTEPILNIEPEVGIGLWIVTAAGVLAVITAIRELQASARATGLMPRCALPDGSAERARLVSTSTGGLARSNP